MSATESSPCQAACRLQPHTTKRSQQRHAITDYAPKLQPCMAFSPSNPSFPHESITASRLPFVYLAMQSTCAFRSRASKCVLNGFQMHPMYLRWTSFDIPLTGVPPGGPYLHSTGSLVTYGYMSGPRASQRQLHALASVHGAAQKRHSAACRRKLLKCGQPAYLQASGRSVCW